MNVSQRKTIYPAIAFLLMTVFFIFVPAQAVVTPEPDASQGVPTETSASAPADPGLSSPLPASASDASTPAVAAPRVSTPAQAPRTVAPSQTFSVQSSPTPAVSIVVTGETGVGTDSESNMFFGLIAALIIAVGGFAVYKIYKTKTDEKNDNNDRCGNIKELLEQKKKELEDAARNWPEEKIKEIAKDSILGEVRKNETAGKIVDTVESVKEKYDKLKETVEMLQKRYDLCMLEVPSPGDTFKGVIVENSLKDKKILDNLQIEKTRQLENWLLHDVAVSEKQIEKLGQHLADGPWYMHFWQDGKDDVTVVFRDKSFKIKYSDRSTWTKAIEHGRSLGIPAEQLDFTVRSEKNT